MTLDSMTLATDGREPHGPRRVVAPWGETAVRTDTAIAALIGLYVAYSLALWPLVPALIGSHPLMLEVVSGSTLAEVTVGAHSRLGELPVWLAVLAGVPGTMMFDWVFWWAGRRWGDRAVHLLLGNASSPRGVARREARAARLAHMAERFGSAAIVPAYYLPLPTVLIYAASGLTGMRLRTFMALDMVGTLLWVGPVVGLGYAIGPPAVDVVHRVDHYATLLTIVLALAVIGWGTRFRHGVRLRSHRGARRSRRRCPTNLWAPPPVLLAQSHSVSALGLTPRWRWTPGLSPSSPLAQPRSRVH